jgi:hypothetical protein
MFLLHNRHYFLIPCCIQVPSWGVLIVHTFFVDLKVLSLLILIWISVFEGLSLLILDKMQSFHFLSLFVKLLPLPHPPVRARTDARTNPSAQRATQLRSGLARVYAVSRQNQITHTVP